MKSCFCISVWALFIICNPSDAIGTQGVYELVAHNMPEIVQPGQRIMGQVSFRVITAGDPVFDRPFADIISQSDTSRIVSLGADKMNPWQLSANQKSGDILTVGFTMDVPIDFPEGKALARVYLARTPDGKIWEYARILNNDGTQTSSERCMFPMMVMNESASGDAAGILLIPRLSAPTIDGVIGAQEWKSAGIIDSFVDPFGKMAARKSRTLVGYDDHSLYLAFVCEEPQPHEAKIYPHDGAIYQNDCVEIFLNPQANRASFYHFIVDILNQQYDALGEDYFGYNPPWKAAVHKAGDGFSIEASIDFSAIERSTPKPGELWYANVCREQANGKGLSCWQPTYGNFNSPGRFGQWVFDSLKIYFLNNISGLDTGTTDWPLEMKDISSPWREKVSSLMTMVRTANEQTLVASSAEILQRIQALSNEKERLEIKVRQLTCEEPFLMTQSYPYMLFSGTMSDFDRPVNHIDLTLMQNEWVDLAFNVTNLSEKTRTIRFSLRSRPEPDKYMSLGIPGLASIWSQAMAVSTGDGRLSYDAIAPVPSGVFRASSGETIQIWLTMKTPKQAAEGYKGFIVMEAVDSIDEKARAIPLDISIVHKNLTDFRTIHCFTWDVFFSPDNTDWYINHLKDLSEHGVDVTIIHGVGNLPRPRAESDGTLVGPLDFSRLDQLLNVKTQYFETYYMTLDIFDGRPLFGLDFKDPAYEKAFKSWLKAVYEHLAQRGISKENVLVNPFDEQIHADCLTVCRWIKQVDCDYRIILNQVSNDITVLDDFSPLVDIWMPHVTTFFNDSYRPFFDYVKHKHIILWSYYYSQGDNEKLQPPIGHYLNKFWWAFSENIQSICYWAQQFYGDPWYRASHLTTYDTSLTYPTEGDVIPSRRWQAWRQGWQDHCLLSMTRKILEDEDRHAELETLHKLIDQVITVPGDPRHLENAREWCKQCLKTSKQ